MTATAFVVALRWMLDPWLGDALPLVTLYGAVAAAVWRSSCTARKSELAHVLPAPFFRIAPESEAR